MLRFLLGISRAPFLPLSLLCAALGLACAVADGLPVAPLPGLLAMLAAVLAHASVNAFNEYADFRSGLDWHTRRTPFSGGSGSLPASPERAPLALVWACVTLLAVTAIGAGFVWWRGPEVLGLGVLGLVLVITYTPWINRFPMLCLVSPGIGFGPILVAGTALAVSGETSPASLWASGIMGLLVSGLLLANQLPDAEVDARFGRRHLAIVHGEAAARRVLAVLWWSPLGVLALAVGSRALPMAAGLAALPLLAAVGNAVTLARLPVGDPVPTALLGRNVAVCLATPVLLGLGLVAGQLVQHG